MQRAQPWRLSMWRCQRDGKPIGGVGQIQRLLHVKLGVKTQTSGFKSRAVLLPQDGEFAFVQRGRPLACAVGYFDVKLRCIVVKHGLYHGGGGFGGGVDVVGEVAPDDVTRSGFAPPQGRHAVFSSNRLLRSERFLPCGACCLI